MKPYVNKNTGELYGFYSDNNPDIPENSVVVESSPKNGRAIWDFETSTWVEPRIPRLEEFTNAVQSHQESIDYILAMSTALDLLSKYIDTKPQLLKPYWEQLKVKENISPTYIKAVEDAARMYYIPIVELD